MYKVYIAPLNINNTWDTEIDVTDYVQDSGIGRIKRSIDSEDFDFGLFTFDDISIKLENVEGRFNNASDNRSIFCYKRNESKVRVTYTNNDETITTRFKGIINEEGTRVDPFQDEIKLKVLSYDSVFRSTKIEAGLLTNGISSTAAFQTILDRPSITKILNYNVSNINPDQSVILDNASDFDNKTTYSTLAELLKITNSVLVIDNDDNIIIRNREPNIDITEFYGPFDLLGRENIIRLKAFNSGRHRLFTSVKIDDIEVSNTPYQLQYGFKQKSFEAPYITNTTTLTEIATFLVNEFKAEKIECVIKCPIETFADTEILDIARVFYPLRTKRHNGFMPIVGISRIDESDYRLPKELGSVEIRDNIAFKVIAIEENPKEREIDFKLRQIGTSDEDGYFSSLNIAIVGTAIVGTDIIYSGGNPPFYAPYLNAALVGSSVVS